MKIISTDKAPRAIGPYSQAIITNNLVFTAAQVAMDPGTNEMLEGDINQQTSRVIENLKAVLEAAGSSLENAVKVNVFLADMDDFDEMNKIYEKYFTGKPARATVQAANLPKNAKVLIDVIALVK